MDPQMTDPTTLDDILHPGERATAELQQIDAQLACLERILAEIAAHARLPEHMYSDRPHTQFGGAA